MLPFRDRPHVAATLLRTTACRVGDARPQAGRQGRCFARHSPSLDNASADMLQWVGNDLVPASRLVFTARGVTS
ncbi:hypothetical protein E2C01_090539 [Portunus trituberculatus]|uniref:Uncharacterized protein n=1 Tax=Portunus trituberculatus TaxID=210409 RepID=A0A5B7JGU9_PORTR|nr:hypothetical protein [Portunus trituberculatus]